ncbi:phosphoglucosamine mutase [Acaryochloris sp. IP29b_bin.148]|uniref:phosphoglucosamine mutase n=1 Tax=Acaryochloris sp. IP29b_bin.148 TaxID=2969218 RepID=UPI002632790A|nr:phosphoglucosamine mutase [Acaryochloris sp. IP29b_bin.148]
MSVTSQSKRKSVTKSDRTIEPSKFARKVAAVAKDVNLFGTDGIRGRVGQHLTPQLALQVGFCAGLELGQQASAHQPFILGQDSRNSSDMLAMALSAGLTAAGLDVWHVGLCPTPTVAYLAHHTDAVGGVMVSASHNPPEDNGIKFFQANGTKLPPTLQARIEHRIKSHNPQPERWGHHYYRPELTQAYTEAIQTPLQSQVTFQGLRVVLDLAWGAATQLAPAVFTAMGAEVICLHDQPDGDRINVHCGSTHLEPLKAAVHLHNADIGFAFDGDADRVLAIDSQGRTVDGDYILYLWGKALQERQQLPDNLIVATVMSNLGFELAWQQQGGTLIRAAVGDQNVHSEMLSHGSMLGGEQSGHILCPHYGVSGDGLLTALHLATIVCQSQTPLSELVSHSFQTYPQILKNVRVEDRDRRKNWQDCQPLQTLMEQANHAMGDQGRILVRASGTEPLIRVMVEAQHPEMATQWTDRLVGAVAEHLA